MQTPMLLMHIFILPKGEVCPKLMPVSILPMYALDVEKNLYSLVGELRIVSKTGVLLNPLYDQIKYV